MGASKIKLGAAQWFELIILGLLAGVIGAFLSQVIGAVILKFIFDDILVGFSYYLLLVGALMSVFVSLLSGYVALKSVVSTSPLNSLRNIS
jgi:predicted lysophospholipase L1 biosynthesis ABC-type transport system permease subunit